MSVYLYDNVIVDLFRSLFDDSRIHIYPPELSFNLTAQLEKDEVQFPLINLNRLSYNVIGNRTQWLQINKGIPHHRLPNNQNIFQTGIPIQINYQIDIYAVDRQVTDDITRELILYLYQNPTLEINVPYQINCKHKFNLWVQDEVTDNSDTVNHLNNGVLFRNTFNIFTDDAYLFGSVIENQRKVIADLGIMKKE